MKKNIISFIVCISIVTSNLYNTLAAEIKPNSNSQTTIVINEQKYSSIEGEWVRVSYSNYYGMTMKIEKNVSNNSYTGTISSMSKDTKKQENLRLEILNYLISCKTITILFKVMLLLQTVKNQCKSLQLMITLPLWKSKT